TTENLAVFIDTAAAASKSEHQPQQVPSRHKLTQENPQYTHRFSLLNLLVSLLVQPSGSQAQRLLVKPEVTQGGIPPKKKHGKRGGTFSRERPLRFARTQ
ncbi:unnamed protein product, partial [Ectocarpus sp. 8 AP-2014]